MKPQTEEQWLMVLAVIERLYAEVRAGNWDGLRQMLHGYTTPASVSPEPSANQDADAEIVNDILHDLKDRGGLRHAWNAIDSGTQCEIITEWLRIVKRYLRPSTTKVDKHG